MDAKVNMYIFQIDKTIVLLPTHHHIVPHHQSPSFFASSESSSSPPSHFRILHYPYHEDHHHHYHRHHHNRQCFMDHLFWNTSLTLVASRASSSPFSPDSPPFLLTFCLFLCFPFLTDSLYFIFALFSGYILRSTPNTTCFNFTYLLLLASRFPL